MRHAFLVGAAAMAIIGACAASAAAQEISIRPTAWSDNRLGDFFNEDPVFDLEVWGRHKWDVSESVEVRAEGWFATDAVGKGESVLDMREGYLRWRGDTIRVSAGRQIFAWGRADRLNPTDAFGARDHRRLVEDEADMRLGIAAVVVDKNVAGGTLSAIWAPEFRPTRLPSRIGSSLAPVLDDRQEMDESQFALRYERYGKSVDWSVTYAEALDRAAWLKPIDLPDRPAFTQVYPRFAMLGGDVASTIGNVGIRAEAALYDYDRDDFREVSARAPKFALALGADRDLPGNFNVNVQALVRSNETFAPPPSPRAAISRMNAPFHQTWRDTVVGGLLRVQQSFDADRGSWEVSVGGFSGGGEFAQARFTYALADGVRLIAMVEKYGGPPVAYLGRLAANDLFTIGIRHGF